MNQNIPFIYPQRRFPEIAQAIDTRARDDLSRAEDFFPHNTEQKLAEMRSWLKEKKIKELEKVSLYAEILDSDTIKRLEALAARFTESKIPENMKQAIIRNIPRRAVLKPAHAPQRLQGQTFEVGDRVIVATDSGAVPLSAKGTVVGLSDRLIDVVFDTPFIGGTNLSNQLVLRILHTMPVYSTLFDRCVITPGARCIVVAQSPQRLYSISRVHNMPIVCGLSVSLYAKHMTILHIVVVYSFLVEEAFSLL